MTSPNKRKYSKHYLGVVSQIGGADQSAYCPCSLNGSVSHMTHTGGGGFCYSGLSSLGGGKPESTNKEIVGGGQEGSDYNNCRVNSTTV